MAISRVRLNHTLFTLSKKGIVSFVFSKLAFLIFGIIISGTFFYFLFIQQNIQQLNELARNADSIANVIDAVSASPFNTSMNYNTKISGALTFENQTFILSVNNKSLTHPLSFPINNSGSIIFDNCLHIEKNGNVVIVLGGQEPCQ